MAHKPPIPKGSLTDTSSLFNCRPGFPLKLPGKPCPACDGSGVDSLAGLEESDLRKECRGLEKSLKIASRNCDDFRDLYNDKSRAFDRLRDENLSLHLAWKMESANARMFKRQLLHGSKIRLSVLVATLLFGIILGQCSWSFEFAVATLSTLVFLGLNLRSAAEWSERVERMREAEVGFGDCAGEVR